MYESHSVPNVMRDTVEIENGKSSLLEIQVDPFDNPLSFWTKDDQPLHHYYNCSEPQYCGIDKPILFDSVLMLIGKEGKYKCHLIYDRKEGNTEIILKKHLLNYIKIQ